MEKRVLGIDRTIYICKQNVSTDNGTLEYTTIYPRIKYGKPTVPLRPHRLLIALLIAIDEDNPNEIGTQLRVIVWISRAMSVAAQLCQQHRSSERPRHST